LTPSAADRAEVVIITNDLGLSTFLIEGLVHDNFWPSPIGGALQALEVFRLRDFDAVIVDSGIADLNALELIRRLRGASEGGQQDYPRTSIPILVVAGSAGELIREEALAAGADALMEPPVELADLIACLNELLGRKTAN
jgi:DNA-binding response OmpR family regulator